MKHFFFFSAIVLFSFFFLVIFWAGGFFFATANNVRFAYKFVYVPFNAFETSEALNYKYHPNKEYTKMTLLCLFLFLSWFCLGLTQNATIHPQMFSKWNLRRTKKGKLTIIIIAWIWTVWTNRWQAASCITRIFMIHYYLKRNRIFVISMRILKHMILFW